MSPCMYGRVCVRVYLYACLFCVGVYAHVQLHAHVYSRAHVRIHVRTSVHVPVLSRGRVSERRGPEAFEN